MNTVFAGKLDRIDETLVLCFQTNSAPLSRMLAQSAKRPIYSVGSGGSVILAEFLGQCRAQLGFAISSPVTPMAYILENSDPAAASWFFSASGKNHDIQAAYLHGARNASHDLVCADERGQWRACAPGARPGWYLPCLAGPLTRETVSWPRIRSCRPPCRSFWPATVSLAESIRRNAKPQLRRCVAQHLGATARVRLSGAAGIGT